MLVEAVSKRWDGYTVADVMEGNVVWALCDAQAGPRSRLGSMGRPAVACGSHGSLAEADPAVVRRDL